MVAVAGEALTYQGAQTTVTKTMITDLNEAITSGKTALDAIKNSDDYNAAQVTALNKAIAQAQDVVDIYNGKYSSSYNKVNHASVASVGDKDGIVASDITALSMLLTLLSTTAKSSWAGPRMTLTSGCTAPKKAI